MRNHLSLLGTLYIAFGAVGVIIAAFVFLSVTGGGLLTGDATVIAITASVGFFVALFFAVISLPLIVTGLGLLKRRPWSRPAGLVLAALNLFNVPFGTALGIYAFWVLLQDDAARTLGARGASYPAA
jgi:hypothetical protein